MVYQYKPLTIKNIKCLMEDLKKRQFLCPLIYIFTHERKTSSSIRYRNFFFFVVDRKPAEVSIETYNKLYVFIRKDDQW